APQLGFENQLYLVPAFALGMSAKGAWGVNFVDSDVLLRRGDGFIGPAAPAAHNSHTIFSHLYELSFYADWVFNEQLRLRGGINLLWAVHVAEASSQIDFDLTNKLGRQDFSGSIFYYGPMIELHFAF